MLIHPGVICSDKLFWDDPLHTTSMQNWIWLQLKPPDLNFLERSKCTMFLFQSKLKKKTIRISSIFVLKKLVCENDRMWSVSVYVCMCSLDSFLNVIICFFNVKILFAYCFYPIPFWFIKSDCFQFSILL